MSPGSQPQPEEEGGRSSTPRNRTATGISGVTRTSSGSGESDVPARQTGNPISQFEVAEGRRSGTGSPRTSRAPTYVLGGAAVATTLLSVGLSAVLGTTQNKLVATQRELNVTKNELAALQRNCPSATSTQNSTSHSGVQANPTDITVTLSGKAASEQTEQSTSGGNN